MRGTRLTTRYYTPPPGPTCRNLDIFLCSIFAPETAPAASARKLGDPWSFLLIGPCLAPDRPPMSPPVRNYRYFAG